MNRYTILEDEVVDDNGENIWRIDNLHVYRRVLLHYVKLNKKKSSTIFNC